MFTLPATETKVKVTSVYDQLANATKPMIICIGGAGSSKSYSLAQLFIYRFINEQKKIFGICRKTMPALKMTAMKLVIGLLKDYGIYQHCEHNKTDHIITLGNNLIQFFSLDDPERIKSAEFSYLWLEEAGEFIVDDFLILRMRLRVPTSGEINQIFLTCNPNDANNWIADLCGRG